MKKILKPVLPGLLLLCTVGLFAQDAYRQALESITEAELRDHIYFLASDYMNGRYGPSREYEIAAQYAASQFASAGLQAVDSDMDCMDGYFQHVGNYPGVGFHCIAEIDENTIWFGGNNAIVEFDGKDFRTIRGSFSNVYDILKRRDGSIWLATQRGVFSSST